MNNFSFLFLLLFITNIFAASITLTSPLSELSLKEADDFFTNTFNDPIDFDKRRDFMWEELFDESTIVSGNGEWNATFANTGAYVFPLFQGFPDALNLGNLGVNYPILSSKYTLVTFLSRVNERSTKAIYWTHEVNWPDGSLVSASADGYYTNTQLIKHSPNDWVIDSYDFSSNNDWTSSLVKGVRIDSSTGAPAGTSVSYQWVRLTDPDSAPDINITWTTSDVPTGEANNWQTPKVNVYVDSDNSGYDGAFLGRVDYDTGIFTFPSATLAPGDYYVYLKLFNNIDSDTLLATSVYSAKISINGKARLTFINPSMTTGQDYATTELANAWDMESSTDIVNLTNPEAQKNFRNESFSGGSFTAEAYIPSGSAQLHSDVQLWLNIDPNKPIDTSKYRYFTYTMSIDPTNYGNISDKIDNDGGWISRLVWWNEGIAEDGSATKGSVVYEGTHSYTIDLLKEGILATDDSYPSQTGWQGNASLSNLRFDPTETIQDTWFTLYDVKLTATPRPRCNLISLQFSVNDPEDSSSTVALYYDIDNTGYNGTLIHSDQYSNGTHTFTFDMSSLSDADYYIYASVIDSSGNVFLTYADAPITYISSENNHASCSLEEWHGWFAVDSSETPMVGDFNGDGKSDIITFTRDNPNAIGDVYVALSDGTKFGDNTKWHDWFAISHDEDVVIGDFNGDGIDDIATWLRKSSKQIYVALSYGNGMYGETVWLDSIGVSDGDLLFSGDVNADGFDDLILFARDEGKVYVAESYGSGFNTPTIWHNFFAVSTYERPRVGDINGDGRADIITFATDSPTAQGDVYVAMSTGTQFGDAQNSTKWHDWFSVEPSQIIRIGDRNGDTLDDFFTFMPPPSGQVYSVLSEGSQMGPNDEYASDNVAPLQTDLPFVADVDDDGNADVIIFSQAEGKVYVHLTK